MFGTISQNYYILYILYGVIAIFVLVAAIILHSKTENGDFDTPQFLLVFWTIGLFACCAVVVLYVLGSLYISNTSSIQSNNNIKIAISDNYNDAENIIIKEDGKEGYFSSDNENYTFELIDNTLVIKNGDAIVKYISGDNY